MTELGPKRLRKVAEEFCCADMKAAHDAGIVVPEYDRSQVPITGASPIDYALAYRGARFVKQEYYEYSEYTSGYEQIPVASLINQCPWCGADDSMTWAER